MLYDYVEDDDTSLTYIVDRCRYRIEVEVEKRVEVKGMMRHVWVNYEQHAFGKDELRQFIK